MWRPEEGGNKETVEVAGMSMRNIQRLLAWLCRYLRNTWPAAGERGALRASAVGDMKRSRGWRRALSAPMA